jgi:hypothetical protein
LRVEELFDFYYYFDVGDLLNNCEDEKIGNFFYFFVGKYVVGSEEVFDVYKIGIVVVVVVVIFVLIVVIVIVGIVFFFDVENDFF